MIENKLKETMMLFFELEYLRSDLTSISNQNSKYFYDIVENSPSFYRIYRQSFKLFVIELAKVVDSKEHFSLLRLVDYIISNRKYIIWKNNEIEMSRLKFIREEIKKIEDTYLNDIKNLRDKFYAHTDKDRHKVELIFSQRIGFEILEKLRTYFEEISLKLNNQHMAFSSVKSSLTNEMVLLHRYKLIQKFIMKNMREKGNIGELQYVRDIMLGK